MNKSLRIKFVTQKVKQTLEHYKVCYDCNCFSFDEHKLKLQFDTTHDKCICLDEVVADVMATLFIHDINFKEVSKNHLKISI